MSQAVARVSNPVIPANPASQQAPVRIACIPRASPVVASAGPLFMLDGVAHRPISVADLRPGDIGFQYKKHHKSPVQHLIATAQHFFNLHTPRQSSDAHVMHTFIVLRALPEQNTLITADASGGDPLTSLSQVHMDFSGRVPDVHLDPEATYVFYRLGDSTLRSAMARIAGHWTLGGYRNFSTKHSVLATFSRTNFKRRSSLRRLAYLAGFAKYPQAVPDPTHNRTYRMMCSEFVADVAAAALIELFRADHGRTGPITQDDVLQALTTGRAGDAFAIDPVSLLPHSLHRRVLQAAQTQVVGYIPPLTSDQSGGRPRAGLCRRPN